MITNYKRYRDGAARRQVILISRLKYLVATMAVSSSGWVFKETTDGRFSWQVEYGPHP